MSIEFAVGESVDINYEGPETIDMTVPGTVLVFVMRKCADYEELPDLELRSDDPEVAIVILDEVRATVSLDKKHTIDLPAGQYYYDFWVIEPVDRWRRTIDAERLVLQQGLIKPDQVFVGP